MAQTEWFDYQYNPVIEADDPGSWAPGGTWVSAVVHDGTTYHMWFTGTQVETSGLITSSGIGHATSPDGVFWTMDPANPVITMGDPGQWDDLDVLAGAVTHDGTQFKMWYTGAGSGGGGIEVNVGHATSPDGSTWTKYSGGPVILGPPVDWNDLSTIVATTVLIENGTYRMWFHSKDDDSFLGRIFYAESEDGINWTEWPDPVLDPNSGEPGFLFPNVVFDGTTYHMWYVSFPFKVHYAFSSNGLEWERHRGNPVHELADEEIYTLSVLPDGDEWKMWYSHFGTARESRVSYAISVCCPGQARLDTRRIIPAAVMAAGAQGAYFQTDVDLSNADDQSVDYQFQWLPRGVDNSEATFSDIFSLGAGKSVRYANVLAEVFDFDSDSLGALLLRSTSPNLLVMSRTYNVPGEDVGGTFGQAMPAVDLNDFIPYGVSRRIIFGTENANMRTNIGCQNGTMATTAVHLDLFDSEGTSLDRDTMVLKPLGNDQIYRIFDGHDPVIGYVDVSVAQSGRTVYCYGSVLDEVTSDPTTILPQ
jgi:hypothetical protein